MAITQDRTVERLVDGAPPFLIKLYKMVDDKETNSIISWGSTSNTFVISDELRFASEILPRYFKSNRFDSFYTQLRNYGFVKKDWDRLEFEHEYFQQGKQDLLKTIKRKTRRSNFNLVLDNMCTPKLCDQLKSSFLKASHEQKQTTDKILRFKDDNQNTLSEVKNIIQVMSQRLLQFTSCRKRKYVDISDEDLSSHDKASRVHDDVEHCFKMLSEFVKKDEAQKNFASCSTRRHRRIPEFLEKLYDMVEKQELDYLISWKLPERDSFIIWDTNKFETHVIPMYFKHTNLSSFISQLNIYCFKKVSWERREYANKWFVGGRYELLANITRRDKLIGFDGTRSSSQLEGFMTRLRKVQQRQEKHITWLSKYEQQIKSSMNELKQSVAIMENILNKKILKSGENLENVKAQELDKQNIIDNDKGKNSGENHMVESRGNDNMDQQSYFQELGIDQEAVEKIIKMEDTTLIEMDEDAVEEIIEMDTLIETECYESLWYFGENLA